ncbi:PstS family phosphate ABC transporter substrate-binding protein, partial [Klebsiella pneumoniae]|uniref:PstS family phosphate ABC transporter substrate-binding protein n=1 Tax=Klebsiella pneumoniae TaxID=573 RepID=UPI0022B7336A
MVVVPVVAEAFVFLTHASNPVDNLTMKQIQDIYTGKITNWNQVGGEDLEIIAYQRPVNSGSQTGFLELVMKGLTPMVAPTTQ